MEDLCYFIASKVCVFIPIVEDTCYFMAVCVYYCSTFDKAVRVGQKSETMCVYYYCRNPRLCVFIAAVPITKLFARICCRNSGNFLNLGKFRTF